ncbi:translation initiation factor IF-2-like [Camelus ferus]|uniref:Translation initiation factor IF-2-like n=1 Tax=Camelus ferus TaxID=419612 RepID=A0A8B8RWM3_CAMFR|nr:translation initiation factor IF-2-like [Camelus ferus]
MCSSRSLQMDFEFFCESTAAPWSRSPARDPSPHSRHTPPLLRKSARSPGTQLPRHPRHRTHSSTSGDTCPSGIPDPESRPHRSCPPGHRLASSIRARRGLAPCDGDWRPGPGPRNPARGVRQRLRGFYRRGAFDFTVNETNRKALLGPLTPALQRGAQSQRRGRPRRRPAGTHVWLGARVPGWRRSAGARLLRRMGDGRRGRGSAVSPRAPSAERRPPREDGGRGAREGRGLRRGQGSGHCEGLGPAGRADAPEGAGQEAERLLPGQ